jgi:hypothetical protein
MSVSFYCDKKIVHNILNYHAGYPEQCTIECVNKKLSLYVDHENNLIIHNEGYIEIRDILDTFEGDIVPYETFLRECQTKVCCYNKLAGVHRRYIHKFFLGFHERMRKYKRDKNWKII